ncbi:MAG: VIT domain-containing protein [Planctomycetota bacterium]|nr:VIT domain-containing protein [Planctomycetota bacterium]
MMNWSDEARNELERFLVAERAWLAQDPTAGDVDHEEVIADLRAHVREELAVQGEARIELGSLHVVLQRLRPGFGTAEEPKPVVPAATPAKSEPTTPSQVYGVSPFSFSHYLVCGVMLPALALFLEWSGQMLGDGTFLDPIPTPTNIFLIALVPVMNLLILVRDRSKLGPITMGFAGAALATTVLYSILFLPLIPLGVIAIVFMGIGFLILSPLLSMFVTWRLVKRCQTEGAARGALVGGILAVLLLVGNVIPALTTNYGAQLATDTDPAIRARGIGLLRNIGSDDLLLRYCYGAGNDPDGMFEFASAFLADPPSETDARELYYLVTGTPFNSVDPPKSVLSELRNRGWDADAWARRNEEDRARGGSEVSIRAEGLSLQESRLDAQIETEAALYYLEWELEFRNRSDEAKEARAQVQLPPGSYVSRLTLWVNGEEREAAFAETGKVRQAYRDVAVIQRRDPVLVTHSGTDQVMVQCFPVPAHGTLRTRIGITAPLYLVPGLDRTEATLSLPRFLERNFDLDGDLAHEIWLQGRGEYLDLPQGLVAANPTGGQNLARGSLTPSGLDEQSSAVRISLDHFAPQAWTVEGSPESDGAILQTLDSVASERISRLILVLDGGAGLQASADALATALEQIPDGIELGLIIAGGSPTDLRNPKAQSPSRLKALRKELARHDFEGGINAAPSLVVAFDLAQAEAGGAVVWVHGVQPVTFSGVAGLEQRLGRSMDATRIHTLAGAPGINRIVAEYGHYDALVTEPRTGPLVDDLVRLLKELTSDSTRLEAVRKRIPLVDLPSKAHATSKHLARLWAGDLASVQQGTRNAATREAGVALALRYNLVTPRTGAVVLETKAQFDRHGLKPVSVDEVPSVPEPEMIALLILSAALLSIVFLRGRIGA